MEAQEIERKLEREKAHIERAFHVRELGVFGSYVRGDETEGSDIDVLVEFENGHKDFFNYVRLKYHLEELLGKKVDLVMKTAIKSRLRKRIFSEVHYV
jgi:predicted nucleotidyltransferase